MGSEMKFISFFLIFVVVYLGLLTVYGQSAADIKYQQYQNMSLSENASFYDGQFASAPECNIGQEVWSAFTDVPVCVWNYMSFGFAATTVSSDVMLINMFIFIPLSIVAMFMMVKAFVRG